MTDPIPGLERISDPAVLAARVAAMAEDPRGPESHFGSFWFDSPLPSHLAPLSPEYRDAVLQQFRAITGHPFVGQPRFDAFEPSIVDAYAAKSWPYNLADGRQLGAALEGIGHAITRMGVRTGHRCLVVGAEWGNLTLVLARMGCSVTAVDDDGRFAGLLEEQSRRSGVAFKVLQSAAQDVHAAVPGELFDRVVFRDALSECHDPARMIATVRDHLLAPGGRFVLVGEPLLESLPHPWIVNPFGEGIWLANLWRRLKLVFRPSSLLQMLDHSGFDAELHVCTATASGNTIVAYRRPSIRAD